MAGTIPNLLTETEAAALLRISVRTLRDLRSKGAIAHVRPSPRTILYREDDLAAYIEARAMQAAPNAGTAPHPKAVARATSGRVVGITEIAAARRAKRRARD